MKKIRKFATSLSLVLLFAIALSVQANYHIYVYRETGGTGGGPWFQYSGTATSIMGGNIAITLNGTMMLDNRTALSSVPTTIYYNPPPIGGCQPSPCKELF